MKIYLVGGAVRDKLLGIPVKEKDWVVVGASWDDMLALKYRPVGKDFPVFLHPETQEEYALARTERKVGRGYTGFEVIASPDVTLEDDLARRDLTINAIAETLSGELIDPYHGQADLKNKILRHVSPAFIEDPVRILRVARFAARFKAFGFHVAPETNELMKSMVSSGEINALVAERVWKELERALSEKNPEEFFIVLNQCGALSILFPEISDISDIKREALDALVKVAEKYSDPSLRFAALFHAVKDSDVEKICVRYRMPREYRELALLVSRYFQKYQTASQLSAAEILKLFQAVDAFRREGRFKLFLQVCETVCENRAAQNLLWQCYLAAKSIDVKALLQAGFAGIELAEKMNAQKVDEIQKILTHF